MADAWNESPALTLRLVANLRDIRGESGKGERHASIVCLKWLLKHHPQHFRENMIHIPYFGRWKDLLDICIGTDPHTSILVDWANLSKDQHDIVESWATLYAEQLIKDRASYLAGYKSDDPLIRSKAYSDISLAAKWAPTEGCVYDKCYSKLIRDGRSPPSEFLAKTLHKMDPDSPAIVCQGTALMRWYRKTYLSPLREAIGIVETYLCQRRFDDINFSKVPGVAMKMYSKTFSRRSELSSRFAEWQRDVLAGKAKINASTVDPYEIVKLIYSPGGQSRESATAEAFYKTHIESLRAKLHEKHGDNIPSSIFVIDTSGSMTWNGGTPIIAALALGIWGSAIANPSWRDLFFTFTNEPSIVSLADCTTLQQRIRRAQCAPAGYSTNLQATLDLILRRAQERGLTQQDMPSRLVIVSDMQFDEATGTSALRLELGLGSKSSHTNLEVMRTKFKNAGYTMPIIVFWNVRGDTTSNGVPAKATDQGVVMISGFSKSLLTLILEDDIDHIPTPYDMMLKALSDPRYDRLKLAFGALEHDVRERAHQLWQERVKRGDPPDDPSRAIEDWVRAKQQLGMC